MKGKLDNGFCYEYSDEVFDDMELMEILVDLTEVDEKNIQDNMKAIKSMSLLLEKVLGAEQKKALYDSLREGGRVPMSKIANAFQSIIGGDKTGKKLSASQN